MDKQGCLDILKREVDIRRHSRREHLPVKLNLTGGNLPGTGFVIPPKQGARFGSFSVNLFVALLSTVFVFAIMLLAGCMPAAQYVPTEPVEEPAATTTETMLSSKTCYC